MSIADYSRAYKGIMQMGISKLVLAAKNVFSCNCLLNFLNKLFFKMHVHCLINICQGITRPVIQNTLRR